MFRCDSEPVYDATMASIGKQSVKDTIELIGIVAVVASLLLVAYEVRQSNRIAQATVTVTYEIDATSISSMSQAIRIRSSRRFWSSFEIRTLSQSIWKRCRF